MKKLILAASIAAIATGSANAATIYEGKGLTYKLKGDFQVQLRQDVGDDQNLDVEFDDLELKNSVVYDLKNGVKAFGQLDFGFKDAAEDKQDGSDLEEAYIGLDFGKVAVSIGKQNFATDEFGVEAAYELRSEADRFEEQGTDGDDTIRVNASLDNVYIAASYEIEAEGESSENGQSLDLFVSTELSGVELAAAYQTMEATPTSASKDTWGVSAAYDFGVAKLAADFSTTEDVADQYNLAAVVPVDKTTKVAVGMLNIKPETGDDVTEWYANVTYKFPSQKNVSVFAEIADTDEDDIEIGYLAGMRLKF
ncbi:porin [Neptunomonas japonica]|uniref:Porin n=1 Tax=Neptunomonas japonica JAMM 1380 TaxID=1441457 RepID=A0A7R6SV28_9GAMM|nr:porin [Neptunomonas japonica]BBB28966.1 porin [Neptunomonas japonica JAMM 1380]